MNTPHLLPAFVGAPEVNRVYNIDALALLRALPDNSVDMILTDPPYGCGTQVSARRSPEDRFPEIAGVEAINATWLGDAYRILNIGGAIYVFAKWVNMGDWKHELEAVGFDVRNCIIWDKMQHGTGDLFGAYGPQYEMILFAVKMFHKLRGARPLDIIRHPKTNPQRLVHPYEKPVGLLQQLIRNSTDTGNLILDPFTGSGPVPVAARNLGRRFIAGDTDAGYCEIARKRLAQPYTPNMFDTLIPQAVTP